MGALSSPPPGGHASREHQPDRPRTQVAVLQRVVAGVRDGQLGDPTPCADTSVAAPLDHIAGLAIGLRLSAEKRTDPKPPQASADTLPPQWGITFLPDLAALAEAWRDPGAFDGETAAGGVTMPAAGIGLVTCRTTLLCCTGCSA